MRSLIVSGDLSFTCLSIAVRSGIIPPNHKVIICNQDYDKNGKPDFHWLINDAREFQKESEKILDYEILTWVQVLGYPESFDIAIDASVFFELLENIYNNTDDAVVIKQSVFLFEHVSVYSRADPIQKKENREFYQAVL